MGEVTAGGKPGDGGWGKPGTAGKPGTDGTFTNFHLLKNWETFRPFLNFSAQVSTAILI
jgi:hypothetical protein